MIILALLTVVVGILMICGPITLANILNVIGNMTIMNKSIGFIVIAVFFVIFVWYATRAKKRIKIIDRIAVVVVIFAILWILLFFFSDNVAMLSEKFEVWRNTRSESLKVVRTVGAILIAFGTGCGFGTIFNSNSSKSTQERDNKKQE